jgi:hypothetical protein
MSYDEVVSRIEEFALFDERSRWKCVCQSGLLSLGYALVSDLALGRQRKEILIGVAVIICIYHAIYISRYCMRHDQPVSVGTTLNTLSRSAFLRYAAVASGMLLAGTGQRLSAMITLSRLRRNLEDPVTPSKLAQVTAIADGAHVAGIKIQRNALKEIGLRVASLADRTPSLRSHAEQALQALASYSSSLEKPLSLGRPWSLYGLPKHEVRLELSYKGEAPTTLAIGDNVAAPDASYVIRIGTQPPLTGPEAILITGEHPNPSHPTTSTVIEIDGYIFHNVIFQDCTLGYNAGPVDIDSAILIDCGLGIHRELRYSDPAMEAVVSKFYQDAIDGLPASLKIP